ncbi:MAG: septation protein A [Inquilinus sp.]|nr:septation protein A [Inquilinus sp.]
MTAPDRSGPAGADAARPAVSPFLRLALEAGPLLVFFVTNSLYGIMAGTAAFMVVMPIAVFASYRLERRLPIMPLVGCFFVLLFGGLTLWQGDELFIKLKPTIVNLLFAAVLFVGLALRRQYLKLLMGAVLHLDEEGWRRLTWRWAFFFLVLAALNELVWRNVSTDSWVAFKTFGIIPLTLAFGIAQVPLLTKHQIEEPKPGG